MKPSNKRTLNVEGEVDARRVSQCHVGSVSTCRLFRLITPSLACKCESDDFSPMRRVWLPHGAYFERERDQLCCYRGTFAPWDVCSTKHPDFRFSSTSVVCKGEEEAFSLIQWVGNWRIIYWRSHHRCHRSGGSCESQHHLLSVRHRHYYFALGDKESSSMVYWCAWFLVLNSIFVIHVMTQKQEWHCDYCDQSVWRWEVVKWCLENFITKVLHCKRCLQYLSYYLTIEF